MKKKQRSIPLTDIVTKKMEWIIVKPRKSSQAKQGQKNSLVHSAKAQEEMWREEDFTKPAFSLKVNPRLTKGEKKMRKKSLEVKLKKDDFLFKLEDFPLLEVKKEAVSETYKDLNVLASNQEFLSKSYMLIKKSIKKEKQRLKKAISKRLVSQKKEQRLKKAVSKRLVSKKEEEASFNLKEITKFLSERWAEEIGLHGGAPPKKIKPTPTSIDEQIDCLQESIKNQKTVSRCDLLMKEHLVKQLNKLQEKKKQEGACLKEDLSNFPYLSPSENSSVTGEAYSIQDLETVSSSTVKVSTNLSVASVSKTLEPKILGLPNPDNYTCFMNSVWSLLSTIPEFVELLNKSKGGPRSLIIKEVKSVLKDSDSASIMKLMYRCVIGAQAGKQEDSLEFFKQLLEKLKEVPVPVDGLFGVKWTEKSTCYLHGDGSSYADKKDTESMVYELTVPHTKTSLQVLLDNSLNKISTYPCRACGGKEDSYFNDHREILNSSKYLIIHLKRTHDGKTKNNTEVTISETLNFDQKLYRVIGYIYHIGTSASSGHYTSEVYFRGQWWNVNDDSIKDIEKPSKPSQGCEAGLLLQEVSKNLEETFTPVKAHSLKRRPSVIMATPESQIRRRVDLQSQTQRRLDFQETDSQLSSQENEETNKLCKCATSNHYCTICKKKVCNFCSIGDPVNELKRMHPGCVKITRDESSSPTRIESRQNSNDSGSIKSRYISPAKAILLRHKEQEERTRLETIQEEENQKQILVEQAREESSHKFFPGTIKDVIFCGRENQTEWEKKTLTTFYVIVPEHCAYMIRVDKQCQANVADLQSYLLKENLVDISLSYSNITHKGELVQDQQLQLLDTSCLIYSQDLMKEHGGNFWSCTKCRNTQMMGSNRKANFTKSHSKPDCELFEKKLLEGKNSWGDPNKFDKHGRPYGHPEIVGKPTRITKKYLQTTMKNTEKEVEAVPPIPVQNEKRITRPRKRVINSESEESGGESDKEFRPPSALQYSSEESEVENDIQKPGAKKVRRDKKVSNIQISKKGKIKKQMKSELDYEVPEQWKESGLLEAKNKRKHEIVKARLQVNEEGDDFSWKPTEQDTKILREKVISKVYKNSAKYRIGHPELLQESKDLIKKGQKPLAEDAFIVSNTVNCYEYGASRLMDMLQKKKQMRLSFADFFSFDDMSRLIYPTNIIDDLENYVAPIQIKQHMLYVYIHTVEEQSLEAEKNCNKFASLVRGADTLTEAQLVAESRKEAGHFMSLCTSTIQNLKTGAKPINKSRTAQALQRKQVERDIKKIKTPNPVVYLPQYYECPEFKALDTMLFNKASTDERVTAGDLQELTNHVITSLNLKNGVRIQVVTGLTHTEFFEAMSGRKMFFPFVPKENLDEDNEDEYDDLDVDKNFNIDQYRREDVPEEEADYLKGILVEKVYHKTALGGSAKLWLSKTDITRLECYMACVKKYAKSINKEYKNDGPIFVNKDLNPWSSNGKRQPDYRLWCKICKIFKFHSHMTRKMFGSFAASHRNLLVRELAAMAASHTVATQQQRYRSDALQEMQAIKINDYYRKQCKIVEEEMNKKTALPFISDQYAEDLRQDLEEAMKKKEERHHKLEEERDKEQNVRGTISLTKNTKYKIIELIIHADDRFDKGKYNLNIHLARDLMTGKNLVNIKNKKNFLMIMDLVSAKEETKFLTDDLMENLLDLTRNLALIDTELSDEDFVSLCENMWTNKILNLFYNLSDPKKTRYLQSDRLKKLLAEYNETHDWQYCFNNPEITRTLQLYNEIKKQEYKNIRKITERNKEFTARDALESFAEQARKRAEDEEAKKSNQMDIEAEKRRDVFFDTVPETDVALREVNNDTPKKGFTLDMEDVTIQITPKAKRTICEGDNTPLKLRKGPTFQIINVPGIGKTGRSDKPNWSPCMKVQFLGLWIDWSEKPFLKDHHGIPNAKNERNKTFELMRKKTHLICKDKKGKTVRTLLGEITQSMDTLYGKLFKPELLNKRALDYLDKKMEEKYGQDKTKWQPEQARIIKKELLEDLYDKIGERPGGYDSDADDED